MKIHSSDNCSRRHFLISGAMVTAGISVLPRRLFAEQESPVITMRAAAPQPKSQFKNFAEILAYWKAQAEIWPCSRVMTANCSLTRDPGRIEPD
jgi:hypothetical protein